jgi:hypothetical protein
MRETVAPHPTKNQQSNELDGAKDDYRDELW